MPSKVAGRHTNMLHGSLRTVAIGWLISSKYQDLAIAFDNGASVSPWERQSFQWLSPARRGAFAFLGRIWGVCVGGRGRISAGFGESVKGRMSRHLGFSVGAPNSARLYLPGDLPKRRYRISAAVCGRGWKSGSGRARVIGYHRLTIPRVPIVGWIHLVGEDDGSPSPTISYPWLP